MSRKKPPRDIEPPSPSDPIPSLEQPRENPGARWKRRFAEERMEEEVDVVAAPHERRAHAVDQERCVVGDHVDDGVRRRPTVARREP